MHYADFPGDLKKTEHKIKLEGFNAKVRIHATESSQYFLWSRRITELRTTKNSQMGKTDKLSSKTIREVNKFVRTPTKMFSKSQIEYLIESNK